ncbi:hypothetical protein EON81_04300 [bacterium]|nr:MAG: hypothetical protein EON81_04300 [bacterium]
MLSKLKLSFKGGVAAIAVAAAGVAMAAPGAPASGPSALQRKESLSRQFLQNAGQWDSKALFHASTQGLDYWIVRNGAVYDFQAPGDNKNAKGHVVRMSFVGAKEVSGTGLDKSPVRNQFLNQNGSSTASSFGKVVAKDVYPGIDSLHYFNEKTGVRYDLVARPGSDPSRIRMRFAGADGLRIAKDGDLKLKTSIGEVGMGGLFVYQVVNGARKAVPAKFTVFGKDEAGFQIGSYDRTKPLVIDPLVYGSYFGGDNGADKVTGVVSEPDGAIYMTGYTKASAFPSLQGAYQRTYQGNRDAFITRFRGDAYNIDYNTFIGGSGADEALFLATDPSGQSLYLLGKSNSTNLLNALPANVRSLALQPTKKNGTDLFLFRFDKTSDNGLKVAYGSYFAPSTGDFLEDPMGMSVTPNGLILVAGRVDGEMPKAKNAPSQGDIFVTAFSTRGRSIRYSRYFGLGFAALGGLTVDRNGGYYLSGTAAPGFPLYNNNIRNGLVIRGATDAYIAKFDSETSNPIFSASLGGSQRDFGFGSGVDQDGNVFILGSTQSFDYPRTPGTYGQITRDTVVVSKIRGDGSQILASTSLNTGAGEFDLKGVAIDGAGNVAVTGRVRGGNSFTSQALPVTSVPNPQVPTGATGVSVQVTQDNTPGGANYSLGNYAAKPEYSWIGNNATNRLTTWDGFVNVLDGNLTGLIYGSYVGGPNDEEIMAPYADLNGDLWLFGRIDTSIAYRSPGRPPEGGGQPPAPLDVVSNAGFFQDLSDPLRPRRFITPLAFKAIPERVIQGFGDIQPGGGDDVGQLAYADRDQSAHQITAFVTYHTRTDGFVSRFRFGAPVISNVTLAPAILPGGLGATSTVTVNLAQAAPAQGAEVRLDLGSIDFAQFQGSTNPSTVIIRIAAGATSGQAIIESKPVTAPQTISVTANYRGNVSSTSLTVVPWLTQISFTPNQTRGGFRTTGTITLSAVAPVGGVTVALTSNNTNLIAVPATVTVPEGQQTVNFELDTQVVATTTPVIIRASLLGVTRSATITVDPFVFSLSSLSFSPSTIDSGGTSTGTVSINVTAPDTGLTLTLTSSNPVVTVPATVRIDPGATTATFTARGGTPNVDRTAAITASVLGQVATANLTVRAVAFTVSLNPGAIIGGQGTVEGTLTLDNNATATQDLTFTLSSSDDEVTVDPTTVTIATGEKSATFTVTPKATASEKVVTITAKLGARTSSAELTVQAVRLASLRINPTTLRSTTIATGTVTLEAPAPRGGVTVNLELNTSLYQIYPTTLTVTVPEGQSSASFSLKPKRFSLRLSDSVFASAGGVTKSVVVTIQP